MARSNNIGNMLGKITPEKPTARTASRKKGKGGGSGGGKKRPPRKKSAPRRFRKTRFIIRLLSAALAIGFILGFFLVVIYGHDLPDIDKLYDDNMERSVVILDYQGNNIATYGDYFTEFVQYKDLPDTLIDAVIATEDRRFFDHWGIDPRGLARALFINLTNRKVSQGGSTITQQLAKIVFLKPERKLKRKIQEAMLAFWLERKFTKEQIMTMYLNRVYLGAGVYGVDAAAHKYFNKSARELTLYESAMIAGLLKAPSTYSPLNNPHLAAERTQQVLINMVAAEKITEEQKKRATRTSAEVKVVENSPSTKYFTDYVIDEVEQLVGKMPENLIVKTTFRPDLQSLGEQVISKNMQEYSSKNNAKQAAMVVMKPSGAVLAIIGGVDYSESQFNRATQAQRQPGSAFKLFVYTAAMMYGKSPDDLVDDSPIAIGKWRPQNYDGKTHGQVTLREAFANSYNLAAANLAQEVGLENILFIAKKMGIKSALAKVPSIALGSSEVTLFDMTTAFAHLANNGDAVYPYVIEEIATQSGEVIYKHEPIEDRQILDRETVNKVNDIAMSVVDGGTGRSARIGRDVGGKTGTSQDFRDAWFIGYTPQLVTGVWVGNDNNEQMKKVTGGGMPTRIWNEFMTTAMSNVPAKSLPRSYGGWGSAIGNNIESLWDSIVNDDNGRRD